VETRKAAERDTVVGGRVDPRDMAGEVFSFGFRMGDASDDEAGIVMGGCLEEEGIIDWVYGSGNCLLRSRVVCNLGIATDSVVKGECEFECEKSDDGLGLALIDHRCQMVSLHKCVYQHHIKNLVKYKSPV